MSHEEILEACNYIKTHAPKKTEMETLDAAIKFVRPDCSACAEEDLVNPDDAWLVPAEERGKFAGIRGRGWTEGFTQADLTLFKEAVEYAYLHEEELREREKNTNVSVRKEELKNMKNELLKIISDSKESSNIENNDIYKKYMDEVNDISKFTK